MPDRGSFVSIWITIATLTALIFLAIGMDIPGKGILLREGGVVESASALGYLFCAAVFLQKGGIAFLKRHHYIFIVIITFMLRELDFDKRFTTMGILKSRFLISDTVPFAEKIVGAAIILLLIYSVLSTILLHWRGFYCELKGRSVVGLGVTAALTLLVISKTLDGLARKLHGIGIEVGESMSVNAGKIEEILEFGIPVVIFIILRAYFKRKEMKSSNA